ncbi:MAG: PAS domain S-box-containing protein [bacterium]|jgi:PAS domain S-box-containing protein
MRLQTKLIFSIFPIIIFSILGIATWSFHQAQKNIYESSYNYLEQTLKSYSNHLLKSNIKKTNHQKNNIVIIEQHSFQGTIFILNRHHQFIFPSNPSQKSPFSHKHWKELLAELSSQSIVRGIYNITKKKNFLYVAQYIAQKDWIVIYGVSNQKSKELVQELFLSTILISLLLLVLTGLSIMFFTRKILILPINRLKVAAHNITNHKPIQQIQIYTKDELANLARSMESMSLSIQNDQQQQQILQEELKSANDTLIVELSEREEIRDALSDSEEQYQTIFDSVNDAICVLDPITGKIIDVNSRLCEMYNYTAEEIKNTIFGEFIVQEEPYSLEDAILWVKKTLTGGPQLFEWLAKDKWGSEFWIEVNMKQAVIASQSLLVIVIRNITDRKNAEDDRVRLERQLRHRQKMEAIGALAGGIAHDFNNTLHGVSASVEIVYKKLKDGDPSKERLKQALQFGRRAKDLIQQILSFSHQGQEDFEEVQVAVVLEEAVNMMRATLPTTITIESEINKECGLLYGNLSQLHQVIVNLCTNAAHSMEQRGGLLSISIKEVEIQDNTALILGLKSGKYAELLVSDTGIGIPSEIRERIFEPFFTTKAVGKGTGMGLSVAHGIVQKHKGAISVESAVNKGTTFHIYLPIVSNANLHSEENKIKTPELNGQEHILLVDDEVILTELGSIMLEDLGYKVTTASDSNEAFERFASSPQIFDLIITDQTMPHMTGVQLSEKIMKIRRDIPIILATGYSESESKSDPKKTGICAYLRKPFSEEEIGSVIKKVLNK